MLEHRRSIDFFLWNYFNDTTFSTAYLNFSEEVFNEYKGLGASNDFPLR